METKTCVVTGAQGQDGSWLIEQLSAQGHRVIAVRRPGSRHDPFTAPPGVQWISADLLEPETAAALITKTQPDELYNLAALSHVGDSWNNPVTYAQTNYVAVVRLLEAVRQHSSSTRFYQASSSEIYGLVRPSDLPLNEDSRRWPRSPYAVTKNAASDAVRNYRESYDLFAVNGILFNHESERRGPGFVTRRITMGFVQWCVDRTPLQLGDVTAKRDWGYAPDYTQAMQAIVRADEPDDFVVATGVTRSVADFARQAWKSGGYSLSWDGDVAYAGDTPAVMVNASRFRPAEVPVLLGDASKIRERLGWQPTTPFDDWVSYMVNHDVHALVS